MSTVYAGDVGTEIILDCSEDITSATVLSIKVRKPNGVKTTWSAALHGTNEMRYVIVAGDLDISGDWVLQAYVEMPDWRGSGNTAVLRVNRPI